mgnify:CR=1 FL=1
MRRFGFWLFWLLGLPAHAVQTVVSFDALFTGPGQDVHNISFATNAAAFVNVYTPAWDSWAGYAFSTVSNTTDGSWLNQYAAAQALDRPYAVGFHSHWDGIAPEILFDLPVTPKSVLLNNTTYAALAMRNGNAPARKFTDGDYFILTLTAYDLDGHAVAATNHYLADFRGTNTLIQTNWSALDLSWMPPDVASLVGTVTTTDVGAFGPNTPTYFALADFTYAYAGWEAGVAATNPAILCWADGVAAYVPGGNVDAEFADPAEALGPAEAGDGENGSTNVVSLGDGGTLTLTFPAPITDGPGADFAVFENAFDARFLELAFVEVSSDGTNFCRFPSHTLATNPVPAYPAGYMEPEAYGGLAGKHLQGLGTPFDLRTLAGESGLDLNRVTHVRLVDIPGDGSVTDDYGHPLYDPFPTWDSGGFDLDAVGVLHPLIRIGTDTNSPAPALPGFTTLLEYTPALMPPAWTNNAPAPRTNGFYRYRLLPQTAR